MLLIYSSDIEAPDFKLHDHQAWYNKACCYLIQNNIDQAIENLQHAILSALVQLEGKRLLEDYFDSNYSLDYFSSLWR